MIYEGTRVSPMFCSATKSYHYFDFSYNISVDGKKSEHLLTDDSVTGFASDCLKPKMIKNYCRPMVIILILPL